MIWIEHDMQMVADLADRIHVLDYGRTLAEGAPARCAEGRAGGGGVFWRGGVGRTRRGHFPTLILRDAPTKVGAPQDEG